MTPPPFDALANKDPRTVVESTYNKLLRLPTGPYKIVEVWENSVVIDEIRVSNTFLTNHVNLETWCGNRSTAARPDDGPKPENAEQDVIATTEQTTEKVKDYTLDIIIWYVNRSYKTN